MVSDDASTSHKSATNSPLRLVVLISGGGTTLRSILQNIRDGQLNAEVKAVVSSNPNAPGLRYAQEAGIPFTVIQRRSFAEVEQFSQAIFDYCRQFNPDIVVMGGFLKLVVVPPDFEHRVVNIHPSLIPSFCGLGFYGRHVHQAVLDHGAKITGCTVHFVDNEYDHGPIILQRAVAVEETDTAETLARRVFHAECKAYLDALKLLSTRSIKVEGRRVKVSQPAGE